MGVDLFDSPRRPRASPRPSTSLVLFVVALIAAALYVFTPVRNAVPSLAPSLSSSSNPSSDPYEYPYRSNRPRPGMSAGHGRYYGARPDLPSCNIWPEFRKKIPQSTPADHSIIPANCVGMSQVTAGRDTSAGCVPAANRLSPFGHSGHNLEGPPNRLWSELQWGKLQTDCASRFWDVVDSDPSMHNRVLLKPSPEVDEAVVSSESDDVRTGRTAVVLRTWSGFEYSVNQLAWMRAMITELSLDTGGAFQVFMLVDVKDAELDLSNPDTYQDVLLRSIPQEFRDIALLYNDGLLKEWYPKIDEHGAQDQMYQALQIFSQTFPEFDYVWQVEMDLRLTGNMARMLSTTGAWAARQPRKNLWERNSQFFIPELWESYDDFAAHVDEQFGDEGVWGPPQQAHFYVKPSGPKPPPRSATSWGVHEDADLITLAPMVDPISTKWTYEETIHGFSPALNLPRRMAMVSVTRTSRKLLRLISAEQRTTGAWVVSESTPETWSLLHGLKAVYAPHLVTFDFKGPGQFGPNGTGSSSMTPQELDSMIHKGPAWSRAGGEHAGFMWCNDIGLPENRWLDASYFYWQGDAHRTWWQYTNGTCGPPMVLHPVKND